MSKITHIVAREILDSRGLPTIETSLLTDSGIFATASVPSGSQTGEAEAADKRDNDPARYGGMGVLQAINSIHATIAPKLVGHEVTDQEGIDHILTELDGTANFSHLGGNALLSVSMAAIKAAASLSRRPLFLYLHERYAGNIPLAIPGPTFNLINGGKHGAGNLDFQEFHIIPSTRYTFSQALQIAVELYFKLRDELVHRGAIHSVGDEGGFAPNLFTNSDALELLSMVIKNSPYRLNQDIFLGLDVAADTFYDSGKYSVKDSPRALDQAGMINLYQEIIKNYNLFSLEDALAGSDWEGWTKLRASLPASTLLVGDDLVMTNPKLLEKAIEKQSINAVIVKPNQTGTITNVIKFINTARVNKLYTILSHRSGETNDTFIADLAVGLGVSYTKFGAPIRGERIAKYNRLLEIEQFLKARHS